VITQPMDSMFDDATHVLLAGCGGGYDVVGAVPLLVELFGRTRVSLASLSFTSLPKLDGAERVEGLENLYRVPAAAAVETTYCPEAWLARWVDENLGPGVTMWAFEKTGVRPLAHAYRYLIEREGVDAVVLVDGGIDGMLRGDESSVGTPYEDLSSLAAVSTLDVPIKVMACLGLGAELRDGICHEQVFDRIAELQRLGGHLGAVALLPETVPGRRYLEAVDYLFEKQRDVRRSHIHSVVSQAVRGEYGRRDEHVWLSPLLNMFWFFDVGRLAESHCFLSQFHQTETAFDVVQWVRSLRQNLKLRERSSIPL